MSFKEMEHYDKYKANPTIRNKTRVLMALQPILDKKHRELAGTLPDSAIHAEISKHAGNALDTWDPTKGAKLSTHVYNHIRQASRLNYQYQNVVRMSEDKQQGKFKHYRKAMDDLNSELNREPTNMELANRLEWTEKEVSSMKDSLVQDIYEGRMEMPDEKSQFSDDKTYMAHITANLTPDESKLLRDETSGIARTEIAAMHGVDMNGLNYRKKKLVKRIEDLKAQYYG